MLARALGVKSISTSIFLISFLARSVSMSVLNLAMLSASKRYSRTLPSESKLKNLIVFAYLWHEL